jgi:hypothetical protein
MRIGNDKVIPQTSGKWDRAGRRIGGYQPTHGRLDSDNPPRGGSGVVVGRVAFGPEAPIGLPARPAAPPPPSTRYAQIHGATCKFADALELLRAAFLDEANDEGPYTHAILAAQQAAHDGIERCGLMLAELKGK